MSTVTSLVNNNFGGIRKKDTAFSEEKITCSDCQNVELFFTGINSGVGIRTVNGNKSVSRYESGNTLVELIPDGEQVIGIFETNQDGETYCIVYTESTSAGQLYNFNIEAKTLTSLVTGLAVTGNACATDFTQGWSDYFVFSNGVNVKYLYSDTETHTALVVEDDENIHLEDSEERTVSGLGLVVFDTRLWIFNGKSLWYSKQGDCRDFSYFETGVITSAGYIDFAKNITAIHEYLGSLAVFHKDSSALVMLDGTTGFKCDEESPGGCAGYNSLIFHGIDLYFYDDTKKGVFSFKQIVNGDKTLGENIAYDIQEDLLNIKPYDANKIRTLSVVTADRNEVWFLTPITSSYIKKVGTTDTEVSASIILIFDYIRGEWVKRKIKKVNTIGIVNNKIYSAGTSIYEEYIGEDFDGDFIESYYTCSIFNYGSDNTLKITKFPPRITLGGEKKCHLWVRYIKNYNEAKSNKKKELKGRTESSVGYYDRGFNYDSGFIYSTKINTVLKLPSTTFKALSIKFYTTNKSEAFAIKALEFSKLKVKQI